MASVMKRMVMAGWCEDWWDDGGSVWGCWEIKFMELQGFFMVKKLGKAANFQGFLYIFMVASSYFYSSIYMIRLGLGIMVSVWGKYVKVC